MRTLSNLNSGWTFRDGFAPETAGVMGDGAEVCLPHSAVELPFNYFDETAYQHDFTYQKRLRWQPEWAGREVSLVFDGAMADAVVYLGGERIAAHADGYTPFEARLTDRLAEGDNLVTVRVSGAENPAIPPFGGQIDYLTYAGIYRDVWLRVTAPVYVAAIKVEAQDVLEDRKSATVRVRIANPRDLPLSGDVRVVLRAANGKTVAIATAALAAEVRVVFTGLEGIALWDVDAPALYTAEVITAHAAGGDRLAVRFGFRTAVFTADGFLLNGRPLKIRGLNRHQAYPYVGYAMGRRGQRRDAEILKSKLKLNLVRTSHYPQSPWFLDACDELGLMVFEEIPGWQHVGDTAWQAAATDNVRAMIERDWNHPSIVLWGVRVNESQDFHDFYAATNRLAHALDPTRQTGGVRFITDSELLEDVYTMNDFILGNEELPGANRARTALRPRRETTGIERPVPYLITEFNGHMHPTKRYDNELRQAEHVRRYLEVLNAAYGDPAISGAIGWCMADYNTHKDFGSGDRICHHGVLDMFREPKFAASVYASQGDPDEEIVLEPVTFYARGERNIGGILPLIILTNCDEIEFRYGDGLVKRLEPDRETYPHLPHPPVVVDHRAFSSEEMGLWGMKWEDAVVVGYRGGREVVRRRYVADPLPSRLEVAADGAELSAEPKDAMRVIVRALDQAGNLLPFLDEPIHMALSGPARLIGPADIVLKGGAVGFWVETTGGAGTIAISVSSARFAPEAIAITAA